LTIPSKELIHRSSNMIFSQLPDGKRLPLFVLSIVILLQSGCSGGSSAPTKIYEGGGTIPEIVEQPEPPAKGAAKKTSTAK